MSEFKISRRYASAFFQLGKEKNLLAEFEKDIKLILSAAKLNSDLNSIITNPLVTHKQKTDIFKKIFPSVNPMTQNFLTLIVEKKRNQYLIDILEQFLQMTDVNNGVLRAHVTSAISFDSAMISKLENVLNTKTGKKVFVTSSIDTGLKGGSVVQIEDTVYDASVKHQIELLKTQFLQN